MARGLSGDVAALIELLRQDPSPEGIMVIRQLAARTMGLNVKLHKGKNTQICQRKSVREYY